MTDAYINGIGTAVPRHDVHETFIASVDRRLPDRRSQILFRRMVQRAGIDHRYSTLEPSPNLDESVDREGLYRSGRFAGTGARMVRFETHAVELALAAVEALALGDRKDGITHLVVASCTGFTAPGLDQQLIDRLGLNPSVERTAIGFMGCAAAVNALRTARHIVRSDPTAKVLTINLELCTLHLQDSSDMEILLSALLFGDGCAASLVSAKPEGIELKDFRSVTIPDSQDLITWRIGDTGFEMALSGEVPARIAKALRQEALRNDRDGILHGQSKDEVDLWAVHAGGRTILDAVEQGLSLGPDALRWSRDVLRDFGNMSSATLMFVLQRMMHARVSNALGLGMAFGPGLVAETFRFSLPG